MIASRKFFAAMSKYGSDQTLKNAGLIFNGTTVCVPEADVNETATSLYCNPPADAIYVCTGDAVIWLAKSDVVVAPGSEPGTFLTQA